MIYFKFQIITLFFYQLIVKGGENTKSKRLIIILSILVILSIGAVSAGEIDDNAVTPDDSAEVLKADDSQPVLSDSPGNFSMLAEDIGTTGDTVSLFKNYTYDSEADSAIPKTGIEISRPLTIEGNGITIDAKNMAKIFNVKSSDVTIKNIHFVNANASEKIGDLDFSDCGAAIEAYSGIKDNDHMLNNISIIDCTFEDSYSAGHGVVYLYADNVTVTGTTFKNNSAPQRAAGLYVRGGKNVLLSGNKFIENYQVEEGNKTFGGAGIYLYDCKASISDSVFEGNYAYKGGAIFIQTDNVNVINCNFTANHIKYDSDNQAGGGAIFAQGNNILISDCRFEKNTALHTAGAIYCEKNKNITIQNSIFVNNTSADEGGAIYTHAGDNITIRYCEFTENKGTSSKSDSYGGAYRGHNSNNTYVHDCNFTGNYANHNAGGAIEFHSIDVVIFTVENCKFEKNVANSDGGAMYIHMRGTLTIDGCDFTSNTVINNLNCRSGGAILINMANEKDNGTTKPVWNRALKTNILNCNFVDNTAPVMGGALCLRSNNGKIFDENVIENCTFTGNNATWGSAIFLYTDTSMNLTNVVFGKNRANSTSLNISVDKPESYYPSDVTLSVEFTGKDNIANAIWNGGHHNDIPNDQNDNWIIDGFDFPQQDPSHVFMKNITYEIYHDGELKTVTVYPDELKNPVLGYENGIAGENIWQDTHEDAQNITIDIYKVEETSMGSSSPLLSAAQDGLLSAEKTETLVVSVTAPLTDIDGVMKSIQSRLKPGDYTAKARHATDAYYTEASDSVDFRILEGLNITKDTEDTDVYIGDTVTYTVNITNDGELFIKDVFLEDTLLDSDAFEFLKDETVVKWSEGWNTPIEYDGRMWTLEGDGNLVFGDDGKIRFNIKMTDPQSTDSYKSVMPSASVEIKLTFKAKKTGKYNNTITISADGYSPLNATSQNTTVRANSSVQGTNETEMYGDPVNVKVSSENATNVTYEVFDKDGKIVANGTIGPEGTITLTGLPVGNYTVNLTAVVDDYHNPSTNQSYITVTPAPSAVEGTNVTIKYGDPIVVPYNSVNATGVTYEVIDKDGKVVANGTASPNGTITGLKLPVGNYTVNWTTLVDGNHTSATNTSTITVIKVPVDIIVGNVTAEPGEVVTIPIKVIPHDGSEFNGKVTVELPDGTKQVIDIVKGEGHVKWRVPDDYKGDFKVKVTSDEIDAYYPSNGTGVVTVIPKKPPVPKNDTKTPHKDKAKEKTQHKDKAKPGEKTSLAKKETGNPILALLAVLALLGVSINRKK